MVKVASKTLKVSVALSKCLIFWALASSLVFTYQPISLAGIERKSTIDKKLPTWLETRLKVSLCRRQVTVYWGLAEGKTYPIAIGRTGWETPTGTFQITQTIRDPVWINPLTDDIILSGDPENPLGHYWIGFWTQGWIWYGFHGTNDPESVGQVITHGCLRMYNEDVKELFSQVRVGTLVTIVQ